MIKHTHYVDTIAEKIVLIHHEYFFEKVLSATVSSTDYLTDPLVLQSLNQLIDQFWDELFDTKSNPYWKRSDISDSEHVLILQKVILQLSSITQELIKKHWLTLLDKEISTYNDIQSKLQSLQSKITPYPLVTSFTDRRELQQHTTAFLMQSERLEKCLISIRALSIPLPTNIAYDQIATTTETLGDVSQADTNPLRNISSTVEQSKPSPINTNHLDIVSSDIQETPETIKLHMSMTKQPNIAIFKRTKLVGGSIHDKSSNEVISHIPESMIKRNDLKHGDLVKIVEQHGDGKLSVELLERNPLESNWVEMEYCIVSQQGSGDSGKLVIEALILNGVKQVIHIPDLKEQSLEINESDLTFHNISAGNIVNISYWKGRPDKFRVIWKHRM